MNWIPVSSQIPEFNHVPPNLWFSDKVLFTDGLEIFIGHAYKCVGRESLFWRDLANPLNTRPYITHWMPLPDLPIVSCSESEQIEISLENETSDYDEYPFSKIDDAFLEIQYPGYLSKKTYFPKKGEIFYEIYIVIHRKDVPLLRFTEPELKAISLKTLILQIENAIERVTSIESILSEDN